MSPPTLGVLVSRSSLAAAALLALATVTGCVIGEAPDDATAGSGLDVDHDGDEDETLAARVCARADVTRGIDVSYYQGTIDWPTVRADGIAYAFIRVSDGATFRDPKFARNWAGAADAGVIRGAYQFFRPAQDPIRQADLLIEALADFGPGDLPPVIDVEATGNLSPSAIQARIAVWVDRVEAALGVTPIIYTGKYFWRDEVGAPSTWLDHPLWIAQYTNRCPDLPAPWATWTFWQHTDRGRVAGITGNVDLNQFNGDLAALRALADGVAPMPLAHVAADWGRVGGAQFQFDATAPDEVVSLELRVDGYLIGRASPTLDHTFQLDYTFNVLTAGRALELRGLDASGATVALGAGMVDSQAGTLVKIRPTAAGRYQVELQDPPVGAASVELQLDGALVTDAVSGDTRSSRLAIEAADVTPGPHAAVLTVFREDGSVVTRYTRQLLAR